MPSFTAADGVEIGLDARVIEPATMIAALEADDAATVRHPGAAGFRLFADAVGADRRALAAHARMIRSAPLDLDRITAPTLVLAGDEDPLATRPEVLAGAIPCARLAMLSGDHFGAVADPRFASLTVDFLAGRDVGA